MPDLVSPVWIREFVLRPPSHWHEEVNRVFRPGLRPGNFVNGTCIGKTMFFKRNKAKLEMGNNMQPMY
jgi:hypothetical protein